MQGRSVLEVRGIGKTFGGLVAVKDVHFDLREGEIHAIIGPNGAGKTTLLNLLSGELKPSSGRLHLNGADVTGWTPDALSRAGMGRSFQHSLILADFSIFENVRIAAQSRSNASFAMHKSALALTDVTEAAHRALDLASITGIDRLAGEMSHGEQRQLEIAMLLASHSKVMLLDEPTSGMGRAETTRMTEVLATLRGAHTVLLVEHDMDVVFSLADRITVLVYGQVMATGTPDEIRANPSVRSAYLGDE